MKKWLFVISFILSFLTIIVFIFKTEQVDIQSIKNPTAQKGLANWYFQRSYPHNKLPEKGFYQAWEISKKKINLSKSLLIDAPDSWRSIGPYNQGGRTIALAVDPANPNIVYAGSASGGLWKLTIINEEALDYVWERIDTGHPVLGVNAIAIDHRDSNIIYIGTGESYFYQWPDGTFYNIRVRGNYGIGVLKTTDGGKTWDKCIDWTYAQQRGVLVLRIRPDNPDVVFAGTTEGTFRSMDAGKTWDHIHTTLMAVDIAINPDNPDIMFVSCGNIGTANPGIYRSMDGGDSWEKLSNGLPNDWSGKTLLDIYETSPNIIYADIANYREYIGLYKSENNGDTWELLSDLEMSYGAQGYFSHYVRVNPVDNNKIFRAKVVFGYSDNGGIDFTVPHLWWEFYYYENIPHPDHHAFANHPSNPDAFFLATDGGVFRTQDNGLTFQDLNWGYVTTQFYHGFSSSAIDSNFALGGLQDNATAIYDGGLDWQTYHLSGDGAFTAIDDFNNIIYASTQFLGVNRSLNRGINWERLSIFQNNPHNNESAAFVVPYFLAAPGKLYAASTHVYKSEDSGENWLCLNNDKPLIEGLPVVGLAGSKTNIEVVYAVTAPWPDTVVPPYVFITKDGGENWTDITKNLPNRFIVDLYVSPQNENIVYVTLSGFGSSHLFMNTSGGLLTNWIDIGQGLPDVPTNAVIVDPDDDQKIYVGNDLGVWVSTDVGQTWNPFTENMPNAAMVMDLSISESNRKIRAVTHGNGVYERSLLPLEDTKIAEVNNDISSDFQLFQNYPNPFNPVTMISYQLHSPSDVTLKIYNMNGQLVKTLISKQMAAGRHEIKWDGTNELGGNVGSGTYICRLKAGNYIISKKMTLIK